MFLFGYGCTLVRMHATTWRIFDCRVVCAGVVGATSRDGLSGASDARRGMLCTADWRRRYFAAFTTPLSSRAATRPAAFYRPPCDCCVSPRWTDTTAISVRRPSVIRRAVRRHVLAASALSVLWRLHGAAVKAKFHYASWFEASSGPASVMEFGREPASSCQFAASKLDDRLNFSFEPAPN